MLITIKFLLSMTRLLTLTLALALLPRTTFGIEPRPFLARAILGTESDNDLRY